MWAVVLITVPASVTRETSAIPVSERAESSVPWDGPPGIGRHLAAS